VAIKAIPLSLLALRSVPFVGREVHHCLLVSKGALASLCLLPTFLFLRVQPFPGGVNSGDLSDQQTQERGDTSPDLESPDKDLGSVRDSVWDFELAVAGTGSCFPVPSARPGFSCQKRTFSGLHLGLGKSATMTNDWVLPQDRGLAIIDAQGRLGLSLLKTGQGLSSGFLAPVAQTCGKTLEYPCSGRSIFTLSLPAWEKSSESPLVLHGKGPVCGIPWLIDSILSSQNERLPDYTGSLYIL
jgi:hypothetical protein